MKHINLPFSVPLLLELACWYNEKKALSWADVERNNICDTREGDWLFFNNLGSPKLLDFCQRLEEECEAFFKSLGQNGTRLASAMNVYDLVDP